jgi:hypothetical protein
VSELSLTAQLLLNEITRLKAQISDLTTGLIFSNLVWITLAIIRLYYHRRNRGLEEKAK